MYPKPDHQPATFTILNFRSKAFDADRAQLRESGVEFERYDMPDLKTDPDGVMRGQGPSQLVNMKSATHTCPSRSER